MAESFADNLDQANPPTDNYSPPLKPDGKPVEDSSSVAVNLSRRQAAARKTDRQPQLGRSTLKSAVGSGAGRIAGATIGAGVGAIGGMVAGGGGVLAGAKAGASKGQQLGGKIGSGQLLNQAKKKSNQAKPKLSEKIDALGTASKEGSRMLLNTCWASVWVDFTFISLLYLNCHLFASKLLPQLVCQFGEDDIIGTWLGGGRLGKVSGAVGVDGKAFAEIIEILILVVLDFFVLALLSLIVVILYTLYDMITNPFSTLINLIWHGQVGLMWEFFKTWAGSR
ncbi:MAG TPA: hypothetical protein PKG83_03085 [bacterium]|nr:hypothetical protein [bacterium]